MDSTMRKKAFRTKVWKIDKTLPPKRIPAIVKTLVLVFALPAALVAGAFAIFFFAPQANVTILLLLLFLACVVAICIYALFVRTSISDLAAFVQQDGLFYLVLFTTANACHTVKPQDLSFRNGDIVEGGIHYKGISAEAKREQRENGVLALTCEESLRLYRIVRVKSIEEHKKYYRLRCIAYPVEKAEKGYLSGHPKNETFRILKTYGGMDELLRELAALPTQ